MYHLRSNNYRYIFLSKNYNFLSLPTTEPKVEIPVLVIMVITIMELIYVQRAIELVAHVAARELVSV